MTDTPKGVFLDAATGEIVERELTPEEIADLNTAPTGQKAPE